MKKILVIALASIFAISCSKKQKDMKPYIIEITTFKYNLDVDPDKFWIRDGEIEAEYTSKQPGYLSRESAFSENNKEILVVVRWQTQADADASMRKFMKDPTVADYAAMIDGVTMKMTRYDVH